MEEKRDRIPALTAFAMLAVAFLVDILHLLVGAMQIIPPFNFILIPVQFLISAFSIGTFVTWYMIRKVKYSDKVAGRMGIFFGLQIFEFIGSMIPGADLIASICFPTCLSVFFTIAAVRKEDRDYNKENGNL